MAGNGYYDRQSNVYLPLSVETWDDYQGTSAGDDWDSLNSWQGTPVLPLTFTTGVIDYGTSQYLNYLVDIYANAPVDIEVRYGDTVDSAGGSIDAYSTVSTSPNQTGLLGKKARYWQFHISIDTTDSAGSGFIPVLTGIQVNLTSDTVQEFYADIDSSTLSGSLGNRQLAGQGTISTITTIITQPHTVSSNYVVNSYVASDYVESAATTTTPVIYIDKTTDPVTLNIYDIDSYGKRKTIDCTFDAIVQGLPSMKTQNNGSIVRG